MMCCCKKALIRTEEFCASASFTKLLNSYTVTQLPEQEQQWSASRSPGAPHLSDTTFPGDLPMKSLLQAHFSAKSPPERGWDVG